MLLFLTAVDGTGNNAKDQLPNKDIDETVTNVLKLHLLAGGDVNNKKNYAIPDQVCIYQRGIGALKQSKKKQVIGDLSVQIEAMLEQLAEQYEEGDKLYIIGYSRGAAAARKFITILDQEGLTLKSGKKVDKPPVEFLGCFETVSMQVGENFLKILRNIIFDRITRSRVLGETGGKLPSIVKRAVHNLALDDNRYRAFPAAFPPVLMDSKDDRVHEAWFPGEHGDVGGSYYSKGVPDTSCRYMQEWMEHDGLCFLSNEDLNPESLMLENENKDRIDKKDLDITPDPSGRLHLNEDQINEPSYRPVITVSNEKKIEGGTVRIHKSVLEHWEALKKEDGTSQYKINPEIKKAGNLVVVGSLDKELDTETKKFKDILRI